MGSHGLHAPPSVPFQNLSSLGFKPLGITEQGQHPPETSGRWRPLEAKGCVTRPLAVEAPERFSEDNAEDWLVPFLKPLLISEVPAGSTGTRTGVCVCVCVCVCLPALAAPTASPTHLCGHPKSALPTSAIKMMSFPRGPAHLSGT
ncbi:hypothetical protein HJG60_009485 [Phyllostomus discolor]|uniref:Uncharacterized protein n=1 Tax=Phyllostomus discolor TaxID=89673 RepID=A0A833YC15_9CHIR|nr:hypothetical protein HJG60_009485 [Phyllostomus discolor]